MKFNQIAVLLSVFLLNIGCERTKKDSNIDTESEHKIKYERYVKIGDYSARILSSAPDGREIVRIPAGTEVKILDSRRVKMGQISGTWYKVEFKKSIGWMSEFNTVGDIIEREILDELE